MAKINWIAVHNSINICAAQCLDQMMVLPFLYARTLEILNDPITMAPPSNAQRPGFSSITIQTSKGANTDSRRIKRETSGELKYLGLRARKQVPNAMQIP